MIASQSTIASHHEPVESPDLALPARTIWGLDPLALHHRYWAAHGVQVVRQGEPSEIVSDAELYLLTDPRTLVYFQIRSVIDVLKWINPQVLFLRLRDDRERGYRERIVTDDSFASNACTMEARTSVWPASR